MNALRKDIVRPEQLECEFIPPLEAQDSWGPSWEKQLGAAVAWQEAGGNTDGQAAQWVEPVTGRSTPTRAENWMSSRDMASRTHVSPTDEASAGCGPQAANDATRQTDRRRQAVMIGFPDRRRTA